MPSAAAAETVAVLSGPSVTGMAPRFCEPSLPPGRQSWLTIDELVVVHDSPARAPRLQVPVSGLVDDGVPDTVQIGHGCEGMPVRKVCELSDSDRSVVVPLAM